MKYLVKLSPEITIKSKGVRKRCILRLKGNIMMHLDAELIDGNVYDTWDAIYVEVSDVESPEKMQYILASIPGIGYFSEIQEYSLPESYNKDIESTFDYISEKAFEYYKDRIAHKSFVVRSKRTGNHTFKSIEVERYVGHKLLRASEGASVSLSSPDVEVSIGIKDSKFFIIKDKIEGIGGYPVGFQERLISLISGGFDSSVSTFSMMKRGCQTDYLFFNLGGNAHELGVKHVSHYLWKRFSAPHKKAKFITVPFEEVVSELLQNVNHKFRGIILKRLMLRAASLIAKNRYYALVKGDSLGQVSSQTLKNMYTIDKASDALVLRPLISMNKQEIINITKQIGTYDFACSMPEYCGVISDNPSAGAKYEDIIEEEAKLPEGLVEKVLEGKKIEFVRDMLDKIEREGEIQEVQGVGEDDIIVDVREPERVKKSPLSHKGYENVTVIPFYEINHSFKNLDQSKTYLFYCDKGVISKLHGLYLQEKGFHNIKVFRP